MTHAFDHEYWDQIWDGSRSRAMGSGEPNPHLVQEIGGLTPGSALDAGCGAGAEAIWLAQQGWQVTGVDIATAAVDLAAQRAAAASVEDRVRWVQADLSTWEPANPFDLVTTHYAHPSTPQLEFYDRIADWVAPSGTLLVVGHLHQPGDQHGGDQHGGDQHGGDQCGGDQCGGDQHGRHQDGDDHGPPAAASATAAAITARLDPDVWQIVTAAESHRNAGNVDGPEVTLHDVVVRATRLR